MISLLAAAKISLCFGRRNGVVPVTAFPFQWLHVIFYCIDIPMIWHVLYLYHFMLNKSCLSLSLSLSLCIFGNPAINKSWFTAVEHKIVESIKSGVIVSRYVQNTYSTGCCDIPIRKLRNQLKVINWCRTGDNWAPQKWCNCRAICRPCGVT